MRYYSCIIPVFNEESRVSHVLRTISKVKEISEIVCVDDGSTDNSTKVIREYFPQVKLIQHKQNLGKTAAIITGINSTKHDTIVLIDSDHKNLKSFEISQAITSFEQNKLDCLLLKTVPMSRTDHVLRYFFRFIFLCTGHRIIRKHHLRKSLRSGNFKSYHLEIAQNQYLMENNKKVAYFDISAKNVGKISKEGLIKGYLNEIKMWHQIITFAGLKFFIRHSLFFANKKVS